MNAIQRRYPQVYKSNDRLLLKPETIGIGLRDFMISIKSNYFLFFGFAEIHIYLFIFAELVPSSARSSSSAATPLPVQFVPLLEDTLEKVKQVIYRVMPVEKKLSALEEAEFEDEGGEEGALEKELFSQCLSYNLYRAISGLLYYFISYQPCKHCVYIDQELLSMVQLVWVRGISVPLPSII